MQVGSYIDSEVAKPAQVRNQSKLAQHIHDLLTVDLFAFHYSFETCYIKDVIGFDNLLSV